jgi:hypothetical protein
VDSAVSSQRLEIPLRIVVLDKMDGWMNGCFGGSENVFEEKKHNSLFSSVGVVGVAEEPIET